jgi:hypothetical protein
MIHLLQSAIAYYKYCVKINLKLGGETPWAGKPHGRGNPAPTVVYSKTTVLLP